MTGIVRSVAPAIERKQSQRLLANRSAMSPASPDGNTRATAHTFETCRTSSPSGLTPKKRNATPVHASDGLARDTALGDGRRVSFFRREAAGRWAAARFGRVRGGS